MRVWILGLLLCQAASYAVGRVDAASENAVTSNFIFRGADRGPAGIISSSYGEYDLLGGWSVGLENWRYLQLSNTIGVGEARVGGYAKYRASRWATLTAGYRYYERRNRPGALFQGPDTQEIYVGATANLPGAPTLMMYYDLDNLVGAYFEATAHQRIPLGSSPWNAEVRGLVGFDTGRTEGFSAAAAGLDLRYDLLPGLRLGPSVDVWFPANDVDPNQDARVVVSGVVEYRKAF